MRTILFTIILILNLHFDLRAQRESLAGFAVDIYDPSANQFFDQYNNIDHIAILYKEGKPEVVDIYFQSNAAPIFGERYTLSFDGDRHLINKKYNHFPVPNDTKARLTYLKGIKKMADVKTVYFLSTKIRRDSIQHQFSFYSYTGETIPNLDPVDNNPKLKGDLVKLTKKLQQDFENWKPVAVTDSLIIISGNVDRKGIIGPLKLIEGRSSDYTKNIIDFMSKEAVSWWPKFDGGGSRPWPVRISVRLNKDGSMKVSIL